jgi:NADP-dependent 3-hydroxy acid dehydrogenase YdfG
VTGCSSGIGWQAALGLRQAGLVVYATARRPGTLTGLAERGIHLMALDVTDQAPMVAGAGAGDPAADCT